MAKKRVSKGKKVSKPRARQGLAEAWNSILEDILAYAIMYPQLKILAKSRMRPEVETEFSKDIVMAANNHVSNIAEVLHEAFYRETKDPQAFLDLITEIVQYLEESYSVRLSLPEAKLQEVVKVLKPGMTIIPKKSLRNNL
jgi:transcriptional regulator NrdR family protein